MKSSQIRQKFLDFFASKGHSVVPSSSLVPNNDPTLLFTNAGMVQFKDVFLGQDKRSYNRAVSSQRCVRAGGKHNDLENVGYTARHHTFFEMLGNFSFGDYFKRDAILYAWEFLTHAQWLNLPKDKLYVTVYATDDEAFDIWHKEVGLAAERIIRIGDNKGAPYASDNFWQMGDTGPCGPCTEIFYDHGEHIWGGLPGTPEEDGDRYIEIWNNVFMQFNRDESGKLNPLPKPSVDTGMGLERISAVLQHVNSNYEIDLFQHLIKAAAQATGCTDLQHNSLKVIADHIRACSFLIADGVIPDPAGRGYVLRRIIRRALGKGYLLGQKKPFFHTLVPALAEIMGDAYPELHEKQAHIVSVLKQEEEQFAKTLDNGMKLLTQELTSNEIWKNAAKEAYLAQTSFYSEVVSDHTDTNTSVTLIRDANNAPVTLEPFVYNRKAKILDPFSIQANIGGLLDNKGITVNAKILIILDTEQDKEEAQTYFAAEREHLTTNQKGKESLKSKIIQEPEFFTKDEITPKLDGETAFRLYDTYGFPFDMTADLCREKNITVDEAGFDAAMARQREQSKAGSKFKMGGGLDYEGAQTTFHGYTDLSVSNARILALYKDGSAVSQLNAGDDGVVVLDNTPFYAESGGQAGDTGQLQSPNALFKVHDTLKIKADVFGHHGQLAQGTLQVGDTLNALVDAAARRTTANNHSATHLLHAALRQILGGHVTQKGSFVDSQRTRFDFSHPEAVNPAQLQTIERLVNTHIQANHPVGVANMSYPDAVASGAMALFGEKYGDSVRVLRMGDFSVELCGGTHVQRTGDIGLFKISSEGGVAAGVRRIEAITGEAAIATMQQQQALLAQLGAELKAQPSELLSKLAQALQEGKAQEKEIAKLKAKLAANQGDELLSQVIEVKGVKVLAALLEGADTTVLRESLDKLKDKLQTAAIVLASVQGDKVSLIAGVTANTTHQIKAGELVNFVAQQVGGKGGGRPDMAQAGGSDPSHLAQALTSVSAWVQTKLA